MKGLLFFLLTVFSVWIAASYVEAYTPEECVTCHTEESVQSSVHMSMDDLNASVHGGRLGCQDCHEGVQDEDHTKRNGTGVVDCNQCHEQENKHGLTSNGEGRPKCYACHTKHRILEKENPGSSVNRVRLSETCQTCHSVECGGTDYFSWLPSIRVVSHGKQDFSRPYEKGNCLGCHQGQGAHGELEPIDDQTCYRCHLDSRGEDALWGSAHPEASLKKQPSIFAAATIYQVFLLGLVWGGVRFYLRWFSGDKRRR